MIPDVLGLVRPLPDSRVHARDCLPLLATMATTFDGLNAVDGRSDNFQITPIQKIDTECALRAAFRPLRGMRDARCPRDCVGHTDRMAAAYHTLRSRNGLRAGAVHARRQKMDREGVRLDYEL